MAVSGYNNRMEFFSNDLDIQRHPPAETRVLSIRAEQDSERKYLHIALELTPFQQRPYIELSLTNSAGAEVASASIIEPMSWKMDLNLHFRKTVASPGKYKLAASISYPELGEVNRFDLLVELPNPA
jgi:hypothetical protein